MNAAIATSLERLVETLGDPQPQIYQRLYAQYPDTKALFVLDTDGGVRGSMLQTTLETILDYAAKDRLDDVSLSAWRSHHQGYDVEPDTFSNFFVIIRDCAKDTLGESWSPEMEHAWQGLIHAVRDNAKA